jgi:nucleoside-diphosphate-sugar epimerase
MQEGLRYTLFRPFNWIGPGLDSLHTPKEGSSRVITQFLGHIVRGEPIQLVDGGSQMRAFTYIDDGISALVKIIANAGGIADAKIYNIGNPGNNCSIHGLAEMMLALARGLPEYRENAARVRLIEVASKDYYGGGYQDVQHRVPDISRTMADLAWQPKVLMDEALNALFAYYRNQVEAAELAL